MEVLTGVKETPPLTAFTTYVFPAALPFASVVNRTRLSFAAPGTALIVQPIPLDGSTHRLDVGVLSSPHVVIGVALAALDGGTPLVSSPQAICFDSNGVVTVGGVRSPESAPTYTRDDIISIFVDTTAATVSLNVNGDGAGMWPLPAGGALHFAVGGVRGSECEICGSTDPPSLSSAAATSGGDATPLGRALASQNNDVWTKQMDKQLVEAAVARFRGGLLDKGGVEVFVEKARNNREQREVQHALTRQASVLDEGEGAQRRGGCVALA
jgi:hypothetical protein